MEEQDSKTTDFTIAPNTRKDVPQYEPSKTSFLRLDKNYQERENDQMNKVLLPSQTEKIPTGKNKTLYLCDMCDKNTNHHLD